MWIIRKPSGGVFLSSLLNPFDIFGVEGLQNHDYHFTDTYFALHVLQMLGKWLYIGGSSDIPGSRSLAYLMTSVWLNVTATSQSNILNLLQTQRM